MPLAQGVERLKAGLLLDSAKKLLTGQRGDVIIFTRYKAKRFGLCLENNLRK